MPPPSVYPSSIFFRLYLSLGSIHPLPLSSPGSLLSSAFARYNTSLFRSRLFLLSTFPALFTLFRSPLPDLCSPLPLHDTILHFSAHVYSSSQPSRLYSPSSALLSRIFTLLSRIFALLCLCTIQYFTFPLTFIPPLNLPGSIQPLPLSSPGSLLSSASLPDLLRSSPLSFPSYCIKNPLFLNNNTADSLLSDILKESIFLCLKKSIAMSWLANTSITSAIAAPSLKSPSPPQAICLPLTIVKTTAHLPLPNNRLTGFLSFEAPPLHIPFRIISVMYSEYRSDSFL